MAASQLVPVVPGTIGNIQCLTVDGRALHGALGVRRVFAAWIQGRIEKFGFVEGQDFEVFSNSGKNSEGGRPSQEYRCSLDMGKELCMVENNEKGRIARRYFIECERRLLSNQYPSPAAPSPLSKRTDPERKALTAIISTWVGMAPIHYANARAQVNAHFGVASVDALTIAQVKEAIQWVQGKIDELGKAKALPPSEMSENDIVDDATSRRLKRVLRDLHAMQEQCGGLIDEVRICLSPKGRMSFLPEKLDNTYKTLQHLNFAATAGVYMARQALISAYHIGRGIEFC